MNSLRQLVAWAAIVAIISLVQAASLDALREGVQLDTTSRQSGSGGNWLCGNWVPYGIQSNACRFICFIFFNRFPSDENTNVCNNGSCDCS